MRTYISDIIPRIGKFSKQLDDLTILTDQHWVSFDQLNSIKRVFIFRRNLELIISTNGQVVKGKWEFIGNQSLLLEFDNSAFLFKHGFFDENILALKVDSKDEYALFINESKFDKEMNSIEAIDQFLSSRYVNPINNINTIIDPQTKIAESTCQDNIEIKELQDDSDSDQWMLAFGGIFVTIVIIVSILIFLS